MSPNKSFLNTLMERFLFYVGAIGVPLFVLSLAVGTAAWAINHLIALTTSSL